MNIDWSYFQSGSDPYFEVIVGCIFIFFLVLLLARIFGLKTFSKMTTMDFAHTIAIGSLIAGSVSGGPPNLLLGGFTIFILFFINHLFGVVRKRIKPFENLTSNTPQYLMLDGKIIHENLSKCSVSENDLRNKNVLKLEDVKAVVFETTGDVNILTNKPDGDYDSYLFEDIATLD